MLSLSPLSSPLGILCHNQFVEDEGENGMRRDPQEMGGGTFVPPGNTFGLECLPEAVKGIRIKSAADFTSDGIFDCVFCKFSIFRVSFSKEKKKSRKKENEGG